MKTFVAVREKSTGHVELFEFKTQNDAKSFIKDCSEEFGDAFDLARTISKIKEPKLKVIKPAR